LSGVSWRSLQGFLVASPRAPAVGAAAENGTARWEAARQRESGFLRPAGALATRLGTGRRTPGVQAGQGVEMFTSIRLERARETAILSTHAWPGDAASMDEIGQIREDLQMVEDALGGSARGAEALAARLRCVPRILAACNGRMGNPLDRDDLDDLTQDTVVVILGKLALYEGRSSLEGWIYRICSLEILNAVRRKRRLPPTAENAIETKDRSAAPEDFDSAERFEDVHRALDRIQAPEADVIRLKHFEDLTFDQIGQLLGCSPSTAKARYYRGLVSLEHMLARGRR
jgi:RNA polymerase sigma-70 factor (ECF subfamily)